MSGTARTKSGVVTGTGAAIEVEVGFTPKHITLVRAASAGTHCRVEAYASMPAASGFKETDDGAGTLTAQLVTTGLVTFEVSPSGKFSIGTDADINIAGVDIYWNATE
jgi:hypothetical protein